MNCKQARTELALRVGGDLPNPADSTSLRLHLAGCPDCRTHYRELKSSRRVLQEAGSATGTFVTAHSVWPSVEQGISAPPQTSAGYFAEHKLAIMATAAACCVAIVSLRPLTSDSGDPPKPVVEQQSPEPPQDDASEYATPIFSEFPLRPRRDDANRQRDREWDRF